MVFGGWVVVILIYWALGLGPWALGFVGLLKPDFVGLLKPDAELYPLSGLKCARSELNQGPLLHRRTKPTTELRELCSSARRDACRLAVAWLRL